jgi:hypothetical protein
MNLMNLLKKMKERMNKPRWQPTPCKAGWYVSYRRGHGMDILFWSGEDDPCFEVTKGTLFYGPFRLPL